MLHLWAILPEELGRCYREFRRYLGACAYRDCRHLDEPDCAVRAAVEAGEIDPGRYERYRAIYRELEEEAERYGRWEIERLRRGRGTR